MSSHFFTQHNRCIFCGVDESAVRNGLVSSICQLAGNVGGVAQGTGANGAYPVIQPPYPFPTAPQHQHSIAPQQPQTYDLGYDGLAPGSAKPDPIDAQAEPKESIDWEAHKRFMKGLDRA